MKRGKAAAVSAFILLSVLLSGCSAHTAAVDQDSTDEPEKIKLQIAIFEGGYGREYWDAVCEAFEKENPDIDIVMQSSAEIGDIIRPTIIAGNPPDFVYLPSNNTSGVTSALIKDHALTDITDVMEEVEERLLPGFLDTKNCQPYNDGKIYLAPMYYSPMGMWYNKDYFEKNSLDVPDTWEEFFALGNDGRNSDRALFAYQGIYPAYMESVILSSIASSAGTEVRMESTLSSRFRTPEESFGIRVIKIRDSARESIVNTVHPVVDLAADKRRPIDPAENDRAVTCKFGTDRIRIADTVHLSGNGSEQFAVFINQVNVHCHLSVSLTLHADKTESAAFELAAQSADLFFREFPSMLEFQLPDRLLHGFGIQHVDFGMSRQFGKKIFDEKAAAHLQSVRRIVLDVRHGRNNGLLGKSGKRGQHGQRNNGTQFANHGKVLRFLHCNLIF